MRKEEESIVEGDSIVLKSAGSRQGYLGVSNNKLISSRYVFGWKLKIFKKY